MVLKVKKGGYKDILMQLTVEDIAIKIQKYENEAISAFSVGWTLFTQIFYLAQSKLFLTSFIQLEY